MLEALIPTMADVTRALGKDHFAPSIMRLFESLCPVQSLAAFAFPHSGRPQLLSDINEQDVIEKEASISRYMNGAYLLDPYFQACRQGLSSGVYRLADLAADDFEQSEYFKQYFQYANFADEIGYLLQLDWGYVHLSLCRTKAFDSEAKAALGAISPWVLAIMGQHWQETEQKSEQDDIHQRLQQAFDQFGQSLLTQREAEVARLLLQGHSTKSMAERLSISMETIKVHKRNLYQKLDIGSQSELFSLFLNSLSIVGPGDQGDPLLAYHQRAKA